MKNTTLSIKDARNNFSEIVERVALVKEKVLVTKFGKPKAMIVPVEHQEKSHTQKADALERTAGLWSGKKGIKDSNKYETKIRDEGSSRYGKIFD